MYGPDHPLVKAGKIDINGYAPGTEPLGYDRDAVYAADLAANQAAQQGQQAYQAAQQQQIEAFRASPGGYGMDSAGSSPYVTTGQALQPTQSPISGGPGSTYSDPSTGTNVRSFGGTTWPPNGGGPGGNMPMPGRAFGGGYTGPGVTTNTGMTGGNMAGSFGGAGMAGGNMASYSANPYLSGMADDIGRRTQQGLGQAFNQIRSNGVASGNLGGDAYALAQGTATGQAMDSQQGQLAGLFGGAWNNDQNRQLQQYGMDQNYSLGMGGLDNQRYGLDTSFYNAQRGLDQSGAALGANLYQQGQQGMWGPINQANGVYGNYTGLGNTTNSQNSGGGWMGALGGALGGAQFAQNMWGGNSNAAGRQSTGWW